MSADSNLIAACAGAAPGEHSQGFFDVTFIKSTGRAL